MLPSLHCLLASCVATEKPAINALLIFLYIVCSFLYAFKNVLPVFDIYKCYYNVSQGVYFSLFFLFSTLWAFSIWNILTFLEKYPGKYIFIIYLNGSPSIRGSEKHPNKNMKIYLIHSFRLFYSCDSVL